MIKEQTARAFYSEFSVVGVGDKNSISTGADDDATNENTARCCWQPRRHNTTDGAKANFLAPLALSEDERRIFGPRSVPNLNLCGHGNPGLLETGAGKNGPWDNYENYIWSWNERVWGPKFDALAGLSFASFSIYSCDTGAEEEGADLLFAIAKRLRHPVRARTGLTLTNGEQITFEFGSTWQVATPSARPESIKRPPRPPHPAERQMILLSDGGKQRSVSPEHIAEVEVSRSSFVRASHRHAQLAGQDAVAFAAAIFASEPFKLSGQPMALVTARVTFVTDDGVKSSVLIYNDRLACQEDTGYAYYCSTSLRMLLQTV